MVNHRLIKLSFLHLVVALSFVWLCGSPALALNNIAGKVADVKGVVLTFFGNDNGEIRMIFSKLFKKSFSGITFTVVFGLTVVSGDEFRC